MKLILSLLILLLSTPALAMMDIEIVTPQRAKELGIELHATPAGPTAARVVIDFDATKELKPFFRVDVEMHNAGQLAFFASLEPEKSKPNHIIASFIADRAQLDKYTLRIVTGIPRDLSGHDLRLKDFIDPKNINAAATPEQQAQFVQAVQKAFDSGKASALDPLICWDNVPGQMKLDMQKTYTDLINEKDVVYSFEMVEPDLKFIAAPVTRDGVTCRPNLPVAHQLDIKFSHPATKKILGILSVPVGQKNGQLLLLTAAPVK